MIFRSTLALCPSCSCHARVEEPSCPHCGAPLRRSAGVATPRSAEAIAVGLTLAVALPVAGCGESGGDTVGAGGAQQAGTGSGRGGHDDPPGSTGFFAIGAYGTAPTVGGSSGSCNDIVIPDPDLASCLHGRCCAELWACSLGGDDPTGCLACFDAGEGSRCDELLRCVEGECAPEADFICESGVSTGDGARNHCLGEACCEAFLACSLGGTDPEGCADCLKVGGERCDDAVACRASACRDAEGICDSGLTVVDAERNACLSDACCDAFRACTMDGIDPDACIACFDDGGGPLCDAARACAAEHCSLGGICDSGLTMGDDEVDACLSDACCDGFRACTTDGLDVDACIACFEAGGGPLCDDAMACAEESCGL